MTRISLLVILPKSFPVLSSITYATLARVLRKRALALVKGSRGLRVKGDGSMSEDTLRPLVRGNKAVFKPGSHHI